MAEPRSTTDGPDETQGLHRSAGGSQELPEQLRTFYTEMGKPDEARRFRILGDKLVAAAK